MSKEKKQMIMDKANEAMDTLVRRFTSSNTIGVERATIKASEFVALVEYINLLLDDVIEMQELQGGSPQGRTSLSIP